MSTFCNQRYKPFQRKTFTCNIRVRFFRSIDRGLFFVVLNKKENNSQITILQLLKSKCLEYLTDDKNFHVYFQLM